MLKTGVKKLIKVNNTPKYNHIYKYKYKYCFDFTVLFK